MSHTETLVATAQRAFARCYRQAPVVFDHGQGCRLFDLEGRSYLDFASGVAVSLLGHNHPALVESIAAQASRAIHVSNLWLNEPAVRLVDRLSALFGAGAGTQGARVFLSNSGAEAIEGALKLARRYHSKVRGAPRPGVVSMKESFHGRTFAAISATGQTKYHDGFEPMVAGFTYADYGDLASLEAAITPETGAVLVEPLQGEGGVRVPPAGYLRDVQALCEARGLLLILDEIQTGVCRTGPFFAFERDGVRPDIVTLAKGLGGGVPIGAFISTDEVSQGFGPGSHASTFGGGPLASAAANVVLDVIARDDLASHVERMGRRLREGLAALRSPLVKDVRGLGLLCGAAVSCAPKAVVDAALGEGLLCTVAGHDVVRMAPPLIVNEAEVDEGVSRLGKALAGMVG